MEVIKESKFDSYNSPTSVGIVATKFFTFANPPDELVLDSGVKFGPITVAYETYGKLNSSNDNAILVFHALSGDAHAAGYNSPDDLKPGWWDNMIGPNKPLDTNQYFVICSNVIGGCRGTTGPSSINPLTNKEYGTSFPQVTINDMIKVQKKLIDFLGIKKLFAVIGGSMGGMQALQWVVSYPESSESAIIIATTAEHTAQQIAFNSIGRYAIISDPEWKNGDYYSTKRKPDVGLSIARMIGHITYLSEEAMHKKFGREYINTNNNTYNTNKFNKNKSVKNKNNSLGYEGKPADFTKEFEVENYLQYQSESFIKRFDPNSYLYITKAIDNFNLSKDHPNLASALKNVKSKCLIISFSSDWLYPKEQSLKIVKALKINNVDTTYVNLISPYGHDAFLIDDENFKSVIKGFLKSVKTNR